jgi:preprotein translocase subunit SecD
MSNLKYRVALIVALVAASLWALFPRTVIERVKRGDVYVNDTVRRVPLKRGLDLQGGMHLALEIDESRGVVQNKPEALDRALKVVRTRIDQFGVSEPVVQKQGTDRIIVELPGVDDPQRAQDVVQKSAFLQFQILDETGAFDRILPRLDAIVRDRKLDVATAAPAARASATRAAPAQSLFTDSADSARPGADTTRPAGRDSVRDSARDTTSVLAAATDRTGPFSRLVRAGGMTGEYFVATADTGAVRRLLARPEIQAALPPGKDLLWGLDSALVGTTVFRTLDALDSRAILTGEYLTDARPANTPIEGTVVEFTLNNVGGRRFRAETGRHLQDYLATVLDDRVVQRPAVIQSAIGTRGQITMGGRALQDAQDFALVLRAGALPVPLKVAETREIGPSLGEDSINSAMLAGAIAVGVIVLIMLVYYRFSGLLAVLALLLYILYTLAVLAGFDAVLTLPGLAGLILSIGIAVDANVLIFERIREELDRGRAVRAAIDEGFKHALSAIVDTSVTTILTALVLYQFGTGPVKGFAVTLIAGIVASLFTAIFVTRTFFMIWLQRTRGAQPLSI